MRILCWIIKGTNKQSELVVLNALTL